MNRPETSIASLSAPPPLLRRSTTRRSIGPFLCGLVEHLLHVLGRALEVFVAVGGAGKIAVERGDVEDAHAQVMSALQPRAGLDDLAFDFLSGQSIVCRVSV